MINKNIFNSSRKILPLLSSPTLSPTPTRSKINLYFPDHLQMPTLPYLKRYKSHSPIPMVCLNQKIRFLINTNRSPTLLPMSTRPKTNLYFLDSLQMSTLPYLKRYKSLRPITMLFLNQKIVFWFKTHKFLIDKWKKTSRIIIINNNSSNNNKILTMKKQKLLILTMIDYYFNF